MSRLTLRLPDSLHLILQKQSTRDGLSLNQYILYALTRQATAEYLIEAVPEREVAAQRERFDALLRRLVPPADDETVNKFLASREESRRNNRQVSPEARAKIQKAVVRRTKMKA